MAKTNSELLKKIEEQQKELEILKAQNTHSNLKDEPINIDSNVEKAGVMLLKKAAEINEDFDNLTAEEQEVYLQETADKLGLGAPALKEMATSDLPVSQILPTLSVRVLEQVIKYNTVIYQLLKYQKISMRANGILEVEYKDYTDNDNLSGFSDVTISDYNQGLKKYYRETWLVDTETHNGYDIMDTILNDTQMSVGLFVALINDMTNNIGRPFQKFMYNRMLTFLDTAANLDKKIAFTADDAKTQAKQIYQTLVTLGTPGRDNLVVKPKGATEALEYAIKQEDTVLVMDVAFAEKYKYDLTASTFQLSEIKLPVNPANVHILDFSKFTQYLSAAPTQLQNAQVLIFDKNFYEEIFHFKASKIVQTPKLKSVLNVYWRLGNVRMKNAVYYMFTKYVKPTPAE